MPVLRIVRSKYIFNDYYANVLKKDAPQKNERAQRIDSEGMKTAFFLQFSCLSGECRKILKKAVLLKKIQLLLTLLIAALLRI
jgi:hypothetical protein